MLLFVCFLVDFSFYLSKLTKNQIVMKRILLPVILFANMAFSQTSEFETKAKSFIASKSKELNISSAHDFN